MSLSDPGRPRFKPVFRQYQWSLVLAMAIVSFAVLTPPSADANGRVIRFDRRLAGPYEVSLGTVPPSPSVGALHLTMTVADQASRSLIQNATVTVAGSGPGAAATEIGPLVAQHNLSDPLFYDISTSVDREGTWIFHVSVNGDLGDGSADFPVEVRNVSPLTGIAALVLLLVFLVVLGLSMRAYLGGRARNRPSPHAPKAGE